MNVIMYLLALMNHRVFSECISLNVFPLLRPRGAVCLTSCLFSERVCSVQHVPELLLPEPVTLTGTADTQFGSRGSADYQY